MKKFFQNNGIWVLIAALLLTGVLTLGSTVIPNFISPFENAIGVLASPFQTAAGAVFGWVEDLYDYAFRYEELQQQVQELEEEVAEMREENREARNAIEENERLRELLNLANQRRELTFLDASITGRSSSSWESTFTLDRGSRDGVEVNQCVVTSTGYLVGVVAEVGYNYCTVTTLIDPDINVGAIVSETGASGMLASDLTTMTEGKCKLTYLASDAELNPGDEVLTSGETGIYPSGIVIGTVDEVRLNAAGTERYALITPTVELDGLTQLFLITSFSGE